MCSADSSSKYTHDQGGRQGLGGQVVRGGPEATGGDHQVGLVEPAREGPADPLGIVADRDHRHEVDAISKSCSARSWSSCLRQAGSELVARGKNDGLLDHVSSEIGS